MLYREVSEGAERGSWSSRTVPGTVEQGGGIQ